MSELDVNSIPFYPCATYNFIMSSGHGLNTRQGRCYPFWSEVARCREQPTATTEKCSKYVEDFLECLFHKKEKRRLVEMIRVLEEEDVNPPLH